MVHEKRKKTMSCSNMENPIIIILNLVLVSLLVYNS